MLAMLHGKVHRRFRGAVRTELVRDHHARRRHGGFQEFLHEPLRSPRVSSILDQDVEHEAILIDGAPQPMLLAIKACRAGVWFLLTPPNEFVDTGFVDFHLSEGRLGKGGSASLSVLDRQVEWQHSGS
jgi:hypothetical protein